MPSEEEIELWREWLHTEGGKGYEAGWGDDASREQAARGKSWVAGRIAERRIQEVEIERLKARVAELEAQVARLTPPPPPPSIFAREQATYRAMLHHLLNTLNAEGQYVVIKGETCLGVERTYDEALRLGYRICGLVPIYVKQITAVEPVVVMRPTVVVMDDRGNDEEARR